MYARLKTEPHDAIGNLGMKLATFMTWCNKNGAQTSRRRRLFQVRASTRHPPHDSERHKRSRCRRSWSM